MEEGQANVHPLRSTMRDDCCELTESKSKFRSQSQLRAQQVAAFDHLKNDQ